MKTHVILSDSAKLNIVLESGLEVQDVEVVADVTCPSLSYQFLC